MFLILRGGGTLSPFGIDFTISFRDAGSDGAVGVMGVGYREGGGVVGEMLWSPTQLWSTRHQFQNSFGQFGLYFRAELNKIGKKVPS